MTDSKKEYMAKCIVEDGQLSFDVPVEVLRQLSWDPIAIIDFMIDEEEEDG